MSAPMIRIAVRDKEGATHVFTLQHEDIQSHEQAVELTNGEFPGALVILATVPNGKAGV